MKLMCILCGKMYTPLQFMCVFKKSAGTNNQFMDCFELMCVLDNFNRFKSFWPQTILMHVIAISPKINLEKICHFPELRISQK